LPPPPPAQRAISKVGIVLMRTISSDGQLKERQCGQPLRLPRSRKYHRREVKRAGNGTLVPDRSIVGPRRPSANARKPQVTNHLLYSRDYQGRSVADPFGTHPAAGHPGRQSLGDINSELLDTISFLDGPENIRLDDPASPWEPFFLRPEIHLVLMLIRLRYIVSAVDETVAGSAFWFMTIDRRHARPFIIGMSRLEIDHVSR
jgi:hypothetical protein